MILGPDMLPVDLGQQHWYLLPPAFACLSMFEPHNSATNNSEARVARTRLYKPI